MFIIRSVNEKDDSMWPYPPKSLYWNNEDGWVDRASATLFTLQEVGKYMWLPIGGEWVEF